MMPFIVYNAGNGERLILDQETGEVTAAYTQPEWLEGVRYIKGLIDGGLLDPVSLTQTRQEYRVMGETEPPVVGTFLASNFQFLTLADKKYENYEAIPPLRSVDTGERQTYANIYQPFQNARFVITKECDYPAAAFRWADFQYSIENSMISRYAKEGEDWVEADPGQKGPFGDPATFQEIGQWGEPTQNSLRQMFAYLSYDVLKGLAMADNSDSYYVMRTTKYRPVSIGNSLPRFFLLPHEVDEYSELRTTLDTYVDETFARFVTGDLPLSEWDRFQSELDKIGIDRYIEMTEAAYKRQYLD
jgi:putative aldouronate transport system substrate-binding protein